MSARLAGLLFAAGAAALIAAASLRPAYNWDIIPYTAAALAGSEGDAVLHERTYALIRSDLSPAAYLLLVDSTQEYRRRAAADPSFFAAQLPFYRIRPLYLLLLRLLLGAGAGPAAATLLLSALGAAGAAAAVWLWTARLSSQLFRLAACLLIIAAAGVAETAGLSTPDALSAALVFGAWYFIFERGRSPALLLPSLLMRPDNIVLLAVTAAYFRFAAPAGRRIGTARFAAVIGGGIALYLGITLTLGTHDLRSVLPMAMIGRAGGAELPPGTAAAAAGYWGAVRGSVRSLVSGYAAYSFFLLCALIPAAAAVRSGLKYRLEPALVAAAGMIVRFAVFPVIANRFYTPCFLLAAAALVLFAGEPVDRQPKFADISR